jgi:hypothetical protein
VLLAGCGGSPPPATPENPQTTLEPSTTKTLPDPLYRLELRNRDDGPVQVEIELTHPENGSVFYESEQTLQSDALRDYSHRFPDDQRVRVTVRVAEDSVTRVIDPKEGYTIAVQNSSHIDVHPRPESSESVVLEAAVSEHSA